MALVCREAGLLALTQSNNIELTSSSDIFVEETHLEQALNDVK